jgi:hypothetical protein
MAHPLDTSKYFGLYSLLNYAQTHAHSRLWVRAITLLLRDRRCRVADHFYDATFLPSNASLVRFDLEAPNRDDWPMVWAITRLMNERRLAHE